MTAFFPLLNDKLLERGKIRGGLDKQESIVKEF